ncbi:MAG: hypothetical protein A2X94_00820 [Bdellovibrionales bacterium GWB1_55_8]|nr:MAG: hypothetical protein A2X94_00820 [Bdellovibrionales bacterium GWB1_55_8]
MLKFNIPNRVYCHGPKKLVSYRFPERLIKEFESLAKTKGWTTTDLITTALDQYVQWDASQTPKKKGQSRKRNRDQNF